MFTQCPNCETTFQVTAEQLKAANGDVRCGQCLSVFNALDNLREEFETNTSIPDSESDILNEENSTDKSDSAIRSSSIDQNLEEFFGDLFEDSPGETFDEPIKHANPEASKNTASRPDGGFFYGANEATIEKILKESV